MQGEAGLAFNLVYPAAIKLEKSSTLLKKMGMTVGLSDRKFGLNECNNIRNLKQLGCVERCVIAQREKVERVCWAMIFKLMEVGIETCKRCIRRQHREYVYILF